MSKDFHNLQDAGTQLAEILEDKPVGVIALVGQGAEIAIAIASKFEVPVIAAVLQRNDVSHEVTSVEVDPATSEGLFYVVDDAVETGHTTLAAWTALHAAGYRNLKLAVPVCPRDSASALLPVVGEIVAVKRPMVRRSLAWHYEELPSTAASDALAKISQHNLALSN